MNERIQLSRAKGWRKPEGAIVVARPSRWGNPWRPCRAFRTNNMGRDEFGWFATGNNVPEARRIHWGHGSKAAALADCVDLFALHIGPMGNYEIEDYEAWIGPLRGHDLACWCPLDRPCHADHLLHLAAS